MKKVVLGLGLSIPVETNFCVCENVEKVWLESNFQAARKEIAWGRRTYAIQHVQIVSGKTTDKNTIVRQFVSDDGKKRFFGVKMSVESQDEDVLFRHGFVDVADKGIGYYTVNGMTVIRKVDNFSDTLLSVDFVNSATWDGGTKLDNALKYGHILRLSTIDSVGYYVMNNDGGYTMIYSPSDKTDVTIDQIKKYIAQNGDVKVDVYWAFINNPSRQRQSSCLFIKGEAGPNGLLDRKAHELRVEKILDSITYGAYNIMKIAYGEKEVNFSKLYKIFSRFSLPMTGSKPVGKIKSIAWYLGDITHDGIPFVDGSGIINAEVLKDNWGLTDPNVCGNLIMARFGTVKGCHNIMSKKAMAEIIKAVAKKMNAEIVFIDKNQPMEYWAGIQIGSITNKIVIIGDGTQSLEEVDFFGDSSVFKTAFDFSRMPFKSNGMSIPKAFNNTVGLSLQCASSFLKVKGAEEVLFDIGKTEIDKILTPKRSFSFSAVRDVLFPDNTLIALSGDDKNICKGWLNSAIKSAINTINMFAFNVEGFHGLITYDLGIIFDAKILKNDEIFVNDRRFWGRRCVIIRYPHNNAGEHKKARIIGIQQIEKRLKALLKSGKISNNQYWLLLGHYNNIKSGVIVVQSTDPDFARLLGGLDYDGDRIVVITESKLVAMWDKIQQCAIDFGSPAPNQAVARFSPWFLNDGYRAMVNNSNDKIGIITNRNMSFMSFESLQDFAEEDMKKLSYMISKEKSLKDYAGYNDKYVTKFDGKSSIVIDAKTVESWDNEVKRCGISNRENLMNILNDVQKINSSVAGRTIDSAKTGEIVLSPLGGLFGLIKGGIISNISIDIKVVKVNNSDIGRKEVVVKKINAGFQTKKSGKPAFIANDVICRVKNKLADYAANRISKYV